MTERKIDLPVFGRKAEIRAASFDESENTVEVIWTTGARVRRYSWRDDSYYDEVLEVKPAAVRLDRLNSGAPLLDTHDNWSVHNVLGSVVPGTAVLRGGKGYARVKLSEAQEHAGVVTNIRAGVITNISVGYRIHRVEKHERGEGEVAEWRVVDWEPYELSAVPVPADAGAQIRSDETSRAKSLAPCIVVEAREAGDVNPRAAAAEAISKEKIMNEADLAAEQTRGADQDHITSTTEPNETQRTAPAVDTSAVEGAIRAERQRVAAIQKLGGQAGMSEEQIRKAVDGGHGVEEFRVLAFDHMAARAKETAVDPTNTRMHVIRDERDTQRRAMSDAIAFRLAAAVPGSRVDCPAHARQFAGVSLVEMAAHAIGYRGSLRTPRDAHHVLERAFHTTSDFPGIFTDAMNVRLLARYQAALPTYRRFSAPFTASDFKPVNVVRPGDFPSLQPVNEAGEIKGGTFGESKETLKVSSYGVMFSVTRQMIINDQLGAIDQVLSSAGVRVADWENAKAFELLKSGAGSNGPTLLTDNKQVFHADHGNLAASGEAITVVSVGKGRAAMAKQKTLDGIPANFAPSILLCSPDKITEAEQLFAPIVAATQGAVVPESIRRIVPVSDANLAGNPWYLFADPMVAPTLHYGYLEGFEGPRLATEEKFDTQGLSVKLEHDFGVAATDYRGAFKNPGA